MSRVGPATDSGGAPEQERFIPGWVRGQSLDIEHLTRYRWAAQFAAGRSVLDAGCGEGHGAVVLADAGAREVVGVDVSESVVEAAAAEMPDRVRLEAGNLRALAYPDGAFDLVVCLGAPFEDAADLGRLVDELGRLLADDGLLVVSTPGPDVDAPGCPGREELARTLSVVLPHARVFRQATLLGAAIVPDDGDGDELSRAEISSAGEADPGQPTGWIAVAGRSSPPEPRSRLGVTSRLEFDRWLAALEAAEDRARRSAERVSELREQLQERQQLQGQLLEAEQRAAAVPDLELRLRELRAELGARDRELQLLNERLAGAEQALRGVTSSTSWRITRPLRAFKGTFGR